MHYVYNERIRLNYQFQMMMYMNHWIVDPKENHHLKFDDAKNKKFCLHNLRDLKINLIRRKQYFVRLKS